MLSIRSACRTLIFSRSTSSRKKRAWAAHEDDDGIIVAASLYASAALRISANTLALLPSEALRLDLRRSLMKQCYYHYGESCGVELLTLRSMTAQYAVIVVIDS